MTPKLGSATTPYGQRITFFNDDYIGRRIRETGIYEGTVLAFLIPLLQGMDNPVVLDIGANIGNHSLALAPHASRLYAFEPMPAVYNVLARNLSDNNLNHARAIHCGLSDHDGEARLHVNTEGNLGASSLEQRSGTTEPVDVNLRHGDSLMASLGVAAVDFVKLDVEGHELAVLEGLERTLCRHRPIIMMEWNDRETVERINHAGIFDRLFTDYQFFVLGNNRDRAYWHGRPFARLRRKLARIRTKRPVLYSFDRARVYKNILMVPREKLALLP